LKLVLFGYTILIFGHLFIDRKNIESEQVLPNLIKMNNILSFIHIKLDDSAAATPKKIKIRLLKPTVTMAFL